MEHIYIVLADTPGIFASMIHRFLKLKYIHVALSLDARLEEAYSVGRRFPSVPCLAGFEREDKRKILKAFPTAEYLIYEVDVTREQKQNISRTLRRDWKQRYSFHYAVLGLLFLVQNRPFYQKKHYTCSSYIAKLLAENGILVASKHFSLVTPRDFYEYREGRTILFDGKLRELVCTTDKKIHPKVEAVYE